MRMKNRGNIDILQLSNACTKELEITTIPIANIIKNNMELMKILTWHNRHGINSDDPIYYQWRKLEELLKYKKNYFIFYNNKNATWGLVINGVPIIFYSSIQGISIQTPKNINEQIALDIITTLKLRFKL